MLTLALGAILFGVICAAMAGCVAVALL